MTIESQSKGIELLIKSMPYPDKITDINLDRKECIDFKWRDVKYNLHLATGSINQVDGQMHVGSDITIVMRRLLQVIYNNR